MVCQNNTEIGRARSGLYGKQWHIFSKTCTLGVCVCACVISQQRRTFRCRMGKRGGVWLAELPPPLEWAELGLCFWERLSYKKASGELQSYEAWLGSTVTSRPQNSARNHVDLYQEGVMFTHRRVWPISCLWTLKALLVLSCVDCGLGLPDEKEIRLWSSVCFLKQGSFAPSHWGRQNGRVSAPPALYVLWPRKSSGGSVNGYQSCIWKQWSATLSALSPPWRIQIFLTDPTRG